MPLPPLVPSPSPVAFVFERGGGAIVHARLSVWSGVGTPAERRELVLFFEDALDDVETFHRPLPEGAYTCVLQVFVREDLNGTYRYRHRISGTTIADETGNVSTGSTPGEGIVDRFEFVLSVEAVAP